jgi:hypothetical protein
MIDDAYSEIILVLLFLRGEGINVWKRCVGVFGEEADFPEDRGRKSIYGS